MFGFPATGQQVGFSEGALDVGHRYSGRRERGLFQRAVEGVQIEPGRAGDVLDGGPGRSRSPLARMTADSRLAYAGLYRMGWYSLTLPWVASSLSSIVGRRPVPRRRRIKRVGFELAGLAISSPHRIGRDFPGRALCARRCHSSLYLPASSFLLDLR